MEESMEMGTVIANKYKLIEKIGNGSFGFVFKAITIKNGSLVAIKFENYDAKSKLLKYEAQIYRYLEGGVGIPYIKWFGVYESESFTFRFMVFDLLGNSLYDLKHQYKLFTIEQTQKCGYDVIRIIKYIHSMGYLHRDVKPENFLFGIGNESKKMYAIDFGLSKRFLDDNNTHIPMKHHKKFTGTIRYLSTNVHEGNEPSRRDDLISVGYMLMFLLKGSLPWQKLNNISKEDKIKQIYKIKNYYKHNNLCNDYPVFLIDYMNYVYNLKYDDIPNYNHIIELFENNNNRPKLKEDTI